MVSVVDESLWYPAPGGNEILFAELFYMKSWFIEKVRVRERWKDGLLDGRNWKRHVQIIFTAGVKCVNFKVILNILDVR